MTFSRPIIAIAVLLASLGTRAQANRFADNPPFVFNKFRETWTAPIGELESINKEVKPGGIEITTIGSGFLISPCYVLTAAHVVYGDDLTPVPGKDYRMQFRAGSSAIAAFAGKTTATPVTSGFRDDANRDDWALLRLNNCIGKRPEIGWLETSGGDFAHFIRDHAPTKAGAMATGYPGDRARGELYGGIGKIMGIDPRNGLLSFVGSFFPGESGGPVIVDRDGVLTAVALNIAELGGVRGATYASATSDRFNLIQTIYEIVNQPKIKPLLDDDKVAAGIPNPNLLRLQIANIPQFASRPPLIRFASNTADLVCERPHLDSDLPTSWTGDQEGLAFDMEGTTPSAISGAQTVSPGQAECLIHGRTKPIILSAIDYPLGPPGALAVAWAAAGSANVRDVIASKLTAIVLQKTGGRKDIPIMVYCHHQNCWSSVNVVKRLVAAGFSQVYWLRDGILGWLNRGAPTATVTNIVSPLTQEDLNSSGVAPPPPSAALNRLSLPDNSASAELPGSAMRFGFRDRTGLTTQAFKWQNANGDVVLAVYDLTHPEDTNETSAGFAAELCNASKKSKFVHGARACTSYQSEPGHSGLVVAFVVGSKVVKVGVSSKASLSEEALWTPDVASSVESLKIN